MKIRFIAMVIGLLMTLSHPSWAQDGTRLFNSSDDQSSAAPLFMNQSTGSAGAVQLGVKPTKPYQYGMRHKAVTAADSTADAMERIKAAKQANTARSLQMAAEQRSRSQEQLMQMMAATQTNAAGGYVPAPAAQSQQNQIMVYDPDKQKERKKKTPNRLFNIWNRN